MRYFALLVITVLPLSDHNSADLKRNRPTVVGFVYTGLLHVELQ